jgi:hypothetical protein
MVKEENKTKLATKINLKLSDLSRSFFIYYII